MAVLWLFVCEQNETRRGRSAAALTRYEAVGSF
jgi:hypothetical protein